MDAFELRTFLRRSVPALGLASLACMHQPNGISSLAPPPLAADTTFVGPQPIRDVEPHALVTPERSDLPEYDALPPPIPSTPAPAEQPTKAIDAGLLFGASALLHGGGIISQLAANESWRATCLTLESDDLGVLFEPLFDCALLIDPTVIAGRVGASALFAGSAITAGLGGIALGRHQATRDLRDGRVRNARNGLVVGGGVLTGLGLASVLVAQVTLRPLLVLQCESLECVDNAILARTIVTDVGMALGATGLGMLTTGLTYRTHMRRRQRLETLQFGPEIGPGYAGVGISGRF